MNREVKKGKKSIVMYLDLLNCETINAKNLLPFLCALNHGNLFFLNIPREKLSIGNS